VAAQPPRNIAMTAHQQLIEAVRHFNRFYTRQIGLLHE